MDEVVIVVKVETLGDLVELEEANKVSLYAAWLEKHTNLTKAQVRAMKLAELKGIQTQILTQTQEALSIPKANSGI